MWCDKCHAGSETCHVEKGTKCLQCGRGSFTLTERPFPDKVQEGKGSGKPRSSYRKPKEQPTSVINNSL